jgi:putative transposase
VQAKGTDSSAGVECAARPCASGSGDTPKYAVSEFMGYLKGKLALRMFQQYESLAKRYWGCHLWARGYCVSTVGLDEEKIRKYVQWQEKQEKQAEAVQGKLFD